MAREKTILRYLGHWAERLGVVYEDLGRAEAKLVKGRAERVLLRARAMTGEAVYSELQRLDALEVDIEQLDERSVDLADEARQVWCAIARWWREEPAAPTTETQVFVRAEPAAAAEEVL